MPGFDRTGPLGQGPMTGGGFGYCNPLNRGLSPGLPLYGVGRGGLPWGGGRGRAFGGGRGRAFVGGRGRFLGFGFNYPNFGYHPYSQNFPVYKPETEREYLENILSDLKEDIGRIQSRLDELATSDDSK